MVNGIYRKSREQSNWVVGALFVHDGYMFKLFDKCMSMGIDILPVDYVFGGVHCKWHGGRLAPTTAPIEALYDIISKYNQYGVGCRFTFSNYDITEEDLDDYLGNKLLKFANDLSNINGVIVSSEVLREYIRNTYPNLHIVSSLIKPTVETNGWKDETVEYYNDLLDRYDVVVINPARAIDEEFLDGLKDHSRIEFIANHRCRQFCKQAACHYRTQWEVERMVLDNASKEDIQNKLSDLDNIVKSCLTAKSENPFNTCVMSNTTIDSLIKKGFKNFKIEGRDYYGITFIRDLGDYIFEVDKYLGLAQSIQEGVV